MDKSSLPVDFVERLNNQLNDPEDLYTSLEDVSPVSIRYNSDKKSLASGSIEGETVDWNSDGIYLSETQSFGKDPDYHIGLYYPMEASSMFLKHVLGQIPEVSGPILDLCAAPGGKSLILKDFFKDQLLVSNEIEHKRSLALRENVIRWGKQNHIVVNGSAEDIAKSGMNFEVLLIDAPCSGEGLFRKSPFSRNEWTEERAAGCAKRQTQILEDAIELVCKNGWIVYSTCTYNPAENLEQLAFLKENGFESVKLEVPEEWGIEEVVSEDIYGYQFWPHRLKGEGFFIGLMRKTEGDELEVEKTKSNSNYDLQLGGFINEDQLVRRYDDKLFCLSKEELAVVENLQSHVKIVKKGVYLGELKRDLFIPSYDLAMQTKVSEAGFEMVDLDRENAVNYIQGQALRMDVPDGIVLLNWNGNGLGFGKATKGRINNYYPKHLRT